MELAHKIRLGGMVKESVFKEMVLEKNSKIQKTTFFVTDFQNEIKVNYKGILPDLSLQRKPGCSC